MLLIHLSLPFKNCLFTLANVDITPWNSDCLINPILEHVLWSFNIYSKWIKNQPNKLFEKLINHQRNIKFTIEINLSTFLDMEFRIKNGIMEISIVVKKSTIPSHWSSAVSKKYKWNAILGDIHRAHEIQSNLELEKQSIEKKILALSFIQSTFNSDQRKFESLIHNWLFQEKHRAAIYFIIPFFFNQMNIIHWSVSKNWKVLQKKTTPLLLFGKQGT